MRVLLTGTRSFGCAVLGALLEEGHHVGAVWAPFGDGLAAAGRSAGLPVRESFAAEEVAALDVDLIVAAHSHAFVSRPARQATRLGGIGYHPSLLPRHRGRDSVRWTVHMGDRVAGGTVYWLTDNVDGGPIAAQQHVLVPPGWNASMLWRKELFPLGVALLVQVLRGLDRGVLVEVPQDERCATWEPSWDRPPLHKPELPQIGSGPAGFRVRTDASALRRG